MIRAYNGTSILDLPPATVTANITTDSVVVSDQNTTDGVRPAIDVSLTAQMSGPIVIRANTTVILGDPEAQTTTTGNHSVVWYDPGTGQYRVWVPGSTYLSVSRVYAVPSNESQKLELGFESYEVLATPLAASKVIQGSSSSLTDAKKDTIQLKAGDKVTIQVSSDSGHHDVYIFKPSNPSYQEVQQATGKDWYYYSTKSDWKIWWPATTKTFTAPEDGTYLIVVVPFNKAGSYQVNVAVQPSSGSSGSGSTSDGSGTGTDIGGVITSSSAAIAIIIIVIVGLAAWFIILPAMGKKPKLKL